VDALVKDIVKLLFHNRRLMLVRAIALSYIGLYRKKNGIRRVTVEWASRPDSSTESRMMGLIQKHIGDGTMEYDSKVNPQLIGGYRIAIDNERLDASVANEFNQLRQQLLSK
ncbi:MAG: F0F1 ATP synthase subunit delta, partial [Muribaculaceae bacterium]|nr:F0F1 ATP synthase subunit delta [Muribaculaceae bacterium]